MLTEAGKEWIAEHLGIGNCWVYSGFSWTTHYTDGTSDPETGGTGKLVARLCLPQVNERIVLSSPRTGTYRQADLTAGNGGNVVTLEDVRDIIVPNDGYPAGENQYCYTPGAPPYVPPTGDTGVFQICTFPGGATIRVDGEVVDTNSALCGHGGAFKNYEVSSGTSHKVTFELLPDYPISAENTKSFLVSKGATIQYPHTLHAIAGASVGTMHIKAKDGKTGMSLAVRPSVSGTTLEERLLTPCYLTLPVAVTKGYSDYNVSGTIPGYAKPLTVVARLKKEHTRASPLEVNLELFPITEWVQVEIVKEMPQIAWVTGISIPSMMAWDNTYDGSVNFIFTKYAKYRAYFDWHLLPGSWDGKLSSLPASKHRINCMKDGETEIVLDPWMEDSAFKFPWRYTVLAADLPEGTYVIVATVQWEAI